MSDFYRPLLEPLPFPFPLPFPGWEVGACGAGGRAEFVRSEGGPASKPADVRVSGWAWMCVCVRVGGWVGGGGRVRVRLWAGCGWDCCGCWCGCGWGFRVGRGVEWMLIWVRLRLWVSPQCGPVCGSRPAYACGQRTAKGNVGLWGPLWAWPVVWSWRRRQCAGCEGRVSPCGMGKAKHR